MNNIGDYVEDTYPEMLVINSEASGLVYATSRHRRGICLFTGKGKLWLTEEQAYAVGKEIQAYSALYSGRGRSSETRERRKKREQQEQGS
jgi:hypothetical protein